MTSIATVTQLRNYLSTYIYKSDLTISSFCDQAGISRSNFTKFLAGKKSMNIDTFFKILSTYNLELTINQNIFM